MKALSTIALSKVPDFNEDTIIRDVLFREWQARGYTGVANATDTSMIHEFNKIYLGSMANMKEPDIHFIVNQYHHRSTKQPNLLRQMQIDNHQDSYVLEIFQSNIKIRNSLDLQIINTLDNIDLVKVVGGKTGYKGFGLNIDIFLLTRTGKIFYVVIEDKKPILKGYYLPVAVIDFIVDDYFLKYFLTPYGEVYNIQAQNVLSDCWYVHNKLCIPKSLDCIIEGDVVYVPKIKMFRLLGWDIIILSEDGLYLYNIQKHKLRKLALSSLGATKIHYDGTYLMLYKGDNILRITSFAGLNLKHW